MQSFVEWFPLTGKRGQVHYIIETERLWICTNVRTVENHSYAHCPPQWEPDEILASNSTCRTTVIGVRNREQHQCGKKDWASLILSLSSAGRCMQNCLLLSFFLVFSIATIHRLHPFLPNKGILMSNK